MNDAADPRDDATMETLPPDLLPIHQRLEHDGGSWRASLPPPDTLLHLVHGRPSDDSSAHEDRAALLSAALSASSTCLPARPMTPRSHSRRNDSCR